MSSKYKLWLRKKLICIVKYNLLLTIGVNE